MSVELARAFIDRLKIDQEFYEKIAGVSNTEERMSVAQAAGYDFTAEEIAAVKGELCDEELDLIAGGGKGGQCPNPHDLRFDL